MAAAAANGCCCVANEPCGCYPGFSGSWDITFSGVLDGGCTCTVNANGLFTVSGPPAISSGADFNACYWEKFDGSPALCGSGIPWDLIVEFKYVPSTTTYTIRVDVTVGSGVVGRTARFLETSIGTPFDCNSFSGHSVPFAFHGGGTACDWSSATCTLTAVP